MATEPPKHDSDELSEMSWQGHRKRQLEALGIDPEELDAGEFEP